MSSSRKTIISCSAALIPSFLVLAVPLFVVCLIYIRFSPPVYALSHSSVPSLEPSSTTITSNLVRGRDCLKSDLIVFLRDESLL